MATYMSSNIDSIEAAWPDIAAYLSGFTPLLTERPWRDRREALETEARIGTGVHSIIRLARTDEEAARLTGRMRGLIQQLPSETREALYLSENGAGGNPSDDITTALTCYENLRTWRNRKVF